MLEAALSYARRGWFVFPCYSMRDGICSCRRPQCVSPGKHPATDNGLTDATLDEMTIRVWWTKMPDANIGVVMEPSGLLALDLDLYHNDLEKLALLEQSLGSLPPTVTQRSGSGDGFHTLFKSPGFPVRGIIGEIVVRSKAYIVVAPSNHASGNNYAWQSELSPDEIEMAELPDSWKEALKKTAQVGKAGAPEEEPDWLKVIPPEQRVADMRAHFAREQGEVKGVSAAGTTFNIVRSAIRANAVRDPEAALEAAMEFDAKCTPPWGARMARHVWSAYQRATSPQWGAAYRGEEQRMEALGLNDVPVTPVDRPPSVSDTELGCIVAELSKGVGKKLSLYQKTLLKQLIARTPILGVDREAAIKVLVQNTPPGATDTQLAAYLIGPSDETIAAIREARSVRAAPTTSSTLADIFAGLPLEAPTSAPTPSVLGPEVDDLPPPDSDDELRGRLTLAEDSGGFAQEPHNLNRIIRWARELLGNIRFNLLTKHIEVTGGRFQGYTENNLATAVMNWLSSSWGFRATTQNIREQLLLVARQNDFNPISEYLESLVWDGVPRLDSWLIDYCRADNTEFNRRVGAMWMISGCARGIHPGAKVDTVLILEGGQGQKKSTVLSILAGPWFSDTPLVIGNKDSLQVASSRFIIELAELSSLRSSETEAQKAFISARIDNYRPPYAAAMEEFPRFAIFGGSTNEKGRYLIDPTGNRRYWPVFVGRCDIIGLRAVRDQLWAEATFRYKSAELNPQLAHELAPGERWWFEDDDELMMAAEEVAKRRPENVWASLIKLWATKPSMVGGTAKTAWTLSELAHSALNIEIDKIPSKQKKIEEALQEAGLSETVGADGQPLWSLPESVQVLPTRLDEPVIEKSN